MLSKPTPKSSLCTQLVNWKSAHVFRHSQETEILYFSLSLLFFCYSFCFFFLLLFVLEGKRVEVDNMSCCVLFLFQFYTFLIRICIFFIQIHSSQLKSIFGPYYILFSYSLISVFGSKHMLSISKMLFNINPNVQCKLKCNEFIYTHIYLFIFILSFCKQENNNCWDLISSESFC